MTRFFAQVVRPNPRETTGGRKTVKDTKAEGTGRQPKVRQIFDGP